jgi:hypothetical protein
LCLWFSSCCCYHKGQCKKYLEKNKVVIHL